MSHVLIVAYEIILAAFIVIGTLVTVYNIIGLCQQAVRIVRGRGVDRFR